MFEIKKCPNLVRGGGVNIFQKCPKFKNVPKVGRGGGSTLIGTLSQIFLIFYFDGSPYQFSYSRLISYYRPIKPKS